MERQYLGGILKIDTEIAQTANYIDIEIFHNIGFISFHNTALNLQEERQGGRWLKFIPECLTLV